jgi:hypothetical protein
LGATRRISPALLVALLALIASGGWLLAHTASSHAASARAASYAQQCAEDAPAARTPGNPLDLAQAPGPDPLNGASFFVPGPAKGAAAGTIAQLLGLDPKTMPLSESWAEFQRQFTSGPLAVKLSSNPTLAHEVAELSKIAAEPEAQRLSIYSAGGGPGAIFAQTEKIICKNGTADPGSIPIFNTYFLHAALGACPTPAKVNAYMPTFHRQISEMAAAIDHRAAVVLMEIDGIGSSHCVVTHHALPQWEAALRYEINTFAALPHTVAYVEGGYSDSNGVAYTAKVLNAVGVSKIRGFFTNDTHLNWTISEVRWATQIAKRTHGAHFIVNTADNGRGPLVNKNRVKDGNEDLCNPPGRGLGIPDTTGTGFAYADAFLWTHPPGNSSGCGGGPPGGTFWPARALMLAENANLQLGPGYPSRPY